MKKSGMRILTILLCFQVLLTALAAASTISLTKEEKHFLTNNPTIILGGMENYPPNFFRDKDGTIVGKQKEYIDLINQKLGLNIKLKLYPSFKEMIVAAKKGEIHGSSIIYVEGPRKQDFLLTNPLFIGHHYIYTRAEDMGVYPNIHALEHVKVAFSTRNSLSKSLIKKYPNIIPVMIDTPLEMIDALIEKKVDAIVHDVSIDFWRKEKGEKQVLEGVVLDETQRAVGMAINKDFPLLVDIINKGIAKISLAEEKKIFNHWFREQQREITLSKEEQDYLQIKKELKVCVDPEWMPFEKIEDGKHVGMSADYLAILAKKIDIPITLMPSRTWLESLELGKQRKCDIFSLVMPTKEREKYLDFTTPYLDIPLVIATTIDKPFINDITTIINQPIGTIKGYAYSEILQEKYPHMQFVEMATLPEALDQLRDKKLFGVIGTLFTIGYNIQKDHVGELKIAGKFDDTWSLGVGMRNDEPLLKNIFNKAIETISRQERQNILNKWISVNYEKGVDYTLIWQVTIVFLLVIIFIMYHNLSMQKVNRKLKDAKNEIENQQQMVDRYVLIKTTDLDGIITHVNDAYCEVTGFQKEELLGKNHGIMRHEDVPKDIYTEMWQTIQSNRSWTGELKNYCKDRRVKYYNVYIEPIFKDGNKIGYRSISEDISDKKRIEELSITDKLTGLYNRMKLDETLLERMEEFDRYSTDFSIILLDIDNFKHINDTYGHDIGDYVLKSLAHLIQGNLRKTDMIGRWGGEEFLIICSQATLDSIHAVAEKIRSSVEAFTFDKAGHITVSLGISQFGEEDCASSLFKRVDDALYTAKRSGKNRIVRG